MKKTTVILPRDGQFRRTIRKDGQPVLDDAGNPRVLTFNAREAVELTDEELDAVRDDVGNVLHIAKVVDDKKKAFKPDAKATAAFVEETRKLREKEAAAKVDAKKPKPDAKAAVVESPRKADIEHKDKAK